MTGQETVCRAGQVEVEFEDHERFTVVKLGQGGESVELSLEALVDVVMEAERKGL